MIDEITVKLLLAWTGLVASLGCGCLASWSAVFWYNWTGWWLLSICGLGIAFFLIFQCAPIVFLESH